MNIKRIIAAMLALSVTLGMAGCNTPGRSKAEIEEVLTKYEKALRSLKPEKVLKLTGWDDIDDEYEELEECFELIGNGEYIIEVYEATASTISVNYDVSDITVSQKSAVVEVEYELVDWDPLYNRHISNTAGDLCDEIRASDDTITIGGEIQLELIHGEWKITEISDLDEVLFFTNVFPIIETPQWPTIPTVFTDPTYDTYPADNSPMYSSYADLLKDYEDRIRAVEDVYGIESCGINDFNRDGIEELLFMAGEEGNTDTADFLMFTYDIESGRPLQVLSLPYLYQAKDGDHFMIFTTIYGELVVVQSYGEEASYTTLIQSYACESDCTWTLLYTYECVRTYDFNEEEYAYFYYVEGEEVEKANYESAISYYVSEICFVILNNYDLGPDELLYPLMSEIRMDVHSFDEMIEILRSEG